MNDDELQEFIDREILQRKIESAQEYSLGQLINDLKELESDYIVKIDNGAFPFVKNVNYAEEGDDKGTCEYTGDYFKYSKRTPSTLYSWRGSYCQLAMEYSAEDSKLSVGELLKMAEFIDGKYLCGYKGGDFLMDLETPIHVDNYSECMGRKLIGVNVEGEDVILKTREVKEDE